MLAILKIRCTFDVQNKPKTKSLMKKFNVVLVGVAIAALTACGPSAAEKAEKAQKIVQDPKKILNYFSLATFNYLNYR